MPRKERAAPWAGLSAQVAVAEKTRQATASIPYARAIACSLFLARRPWSFD